MPPSGQEVMGNIQKEILWGISATTKELIHNYKIVLKHNQDNPGWDEEELELLEEELEHIERLHSFLDSILNGGETLDSGEVKKIIEEERRAEKIESMLEEKQESGNLEMGGKNTVKLTQSLTEFSMALKKYEETEHVRTDLYEAGGWKEALGNELKQYGENRGVETANARYLFGGLSLGEEDSTNREVYSRADYIVLDSAGHPFKGRNFENFLKNQPEAGRLNYEELISENVFRDTLPIVIPDVLPNNDYAGFDITRITEPVKKIGIYAPVIGKGVLPVASSLAYAGVLPVEPVLMANLTIAWQGAAPAAINAVLLPRFFTAVGARMALFCEKLDNYYALKPGVASKPTFYLHLSMAHGPLIFFFFLKYPRIRRSVIQTHRAVGFVGLENDYIDYMEEVRFSASGGSEMLLEYQGQEKIVRYQENAIDTSILDRVEEEVNDNDGGIISSITDIF